jgi:hypothetical protein
VIFKTAKWKVMDYGKNKMVRDMLGDGKIVKPMAKVFI